MIAMKNIPCDNQCDNQCIFYRECETCELLCSALVGMPLLGGACVRVIPVNAKQLGSPHRYYMPGLNAALPVQKMLQHDEPESDTV